MRCGARELRMTRERGSAPRSCSLDIFCNNSLQIHFLSPTPLPPRWNRGTLCSHPWHQNFELEHSVNLKKEILTQGDHAMSLPRLTSAAARSTHWIVACALWTCALSLCGWAQNASPAAASPAQPQSSSPEVPSAPQPEQKTAPPQQVHLADYSKPRSAFPNLLQPYLPRPLARSESEQLCAHRFAAARWQRFISPSMMPSRWPLKTISIWRLPATTSISPTPISCAQSQEPIFSE